MIELSKIEKARIGTLEQAIKEIEIKANRVTTAISNAKSELDRIKLNVFEFGLSNDPFSAYRAAFEGNRRHKEALKNFIIDMQPVPDAIIAGIEPIKTQIDEIKSVAEKRTNDIQCLEEQLTLTGDLPKDQRQMLLELKSKAF